MTYWYNIFFVKIVCLCFLNTIVLYRNEFVDTTKPCLAQNRIVFLQNWTAPTQLRNWFWKRQNNHSLNIKVHAAHMTTTKLTMSTCFYTVKWVSKCLKIRLTTPDKLQFVFHFTFSREPIKYLLLRSMH